MKKVNFIKMAGAGNDFIMIDAKKGLNYKSFAKKVCDRTNGIGADGVIVLDKSAKKQDYKMRIEKSWRTKPSTHWNIMLKSNHLSGRNPKKAIRKLIRSSITRLRFNLRDEGQTKWFMNY